MRRTARPTRKTLPNDGLPSWSVQHDGHEGNYRPGGGRGSAPSLEQAREFIRASKAENTLRGYRSDWRESLAWSEGHGVCPLPASPETVAAYIAECAGRLKVGSIQRRLQRYRRSTQSRGARIAHQLPP